MRAGRRREEEAVAAVEEEGVRRGGGHAGHHGEGGRGGVRGEGPERRGVPAAAGCYWGSAFAVAAREGSFG